MVGETTKDRSPLLPDRRAVPDFFVCDILDAAPKGDMASMEHPVFSISTKPDRRIRRYETTDKSKFIEVTPSMKGLATVHDYCTRRPGVCSEPVRRKQGLGGGVQRAGVEPVRPPLPLQPVQTVVRADLSTPAPIGADLLLEGVNGALEERCRSGTCRCRL